MARIRTIKPEFFRHEGLFCAEKESGLPLRVAFAGLFTAADRSGRFKWRPRTLKLDALPHDDVNFSEVLDALVRQGLIFKYEAAGEAFGCIPSWEKHQAINNREAASVLPAPPENACPTRAPRVNNTSTMDAARVDDACPTPLVHAPVEGNGREGKGTDIDASPTSGSNAAGFAEFWAVYPRKEARQDASKAWSKLKPNADLVAVLMNALVQRKASPEWQREDGKFIPYPATWLNGRRWEDQHQATSAGQGPMRDTGGSFDDP